ncbi:MAG: hypothetical protein SGBAC_012038 [Bacillariaceae sp.]
MISFHRICLLLVLLGSTADALHKVKPLAAIVSPKEEALDQLSQIPRGGARRLPKIQTTTEGASIPSHVFNLVKGIVGVGVLSLPAGIAAFADDPKAVIAATGFITLIGILSAFGFFLIGKVCAYTGATSYRDAWSKSVGDGSSWIPAASCTIKTCLACLAFSMVLGDTFAALLGTARNPTLLALTAAVLLPLCLLKNLSALAPFSLVGVLGMGYTAVAMAIRYFDGSYQPEGALVGDVAANLQPLFGSNANVLSSKSLILVCMLSTAFMAHFNAPKFYRELNNNTLQRFNKVVSLSFGISILLMSGITMLGFLTFGKSCSGLVLNNYSTKDLYMSGSRIAVAISLVFSYPLAFTGCRDGTMDILNIPAGKRSASVQNLITVALLTLFTCGAIVLKDVSFVLAFGGATFGNLLTYVYPALMYRAIVRQQGRTEENGAVAASLFSACLGIVMGIIGTKMAIQNIS